MLACDLCFELHRLIVIAEMKVNTVCAVYGCTPQCPSTKFHRFPKDDRLCATWVQACRRLDNINTRTAKICDQHFSDEQKKRNLQAELMPQRPVSKNYRDLKPDAVPDINLPGRMNNSQGMYALISGNRLLTV